MLKISLLTVIFCSTKTHYYFQSVWFNIPLKEVTLPYLYVTLWKNILFFFVLLQQYLIFYCHIQDKKYISLHATLSLLF
jgi:hypothetical protein